MEAALSEVKVSNATANTKVYLETPNSLSYLEFPYTAILTRYLSRIQETGSGYP